MGARGCRLTIVACFCGLACVFGAGVVPGASAAELGAFDHGRLDPDVASVPAPVPAGEGGGPAMPPKVHSGPAKQGTRMVKLTAPDCGYTVRTTRKWIDQGAPMCPHGVAMEEV